MNGYLDTLKVADVGRFEQGLLGELRASGKDILEAIQTSGQLDGDTEKKLKGLLDKFLERFALRAPAPMPSLKDMRARMNSVRQTRKITSAMKLVAASKLRRAQEQAEASRPFAAAHGGDAGRISRPASPACPARRRCWPAPARTRCTC